MPTNLDELLNEAFKRRRQKCCYETTYSHDIVKEWLESAIAITAEDWKIIVPIFNSTEQSSSPSAVLQWPNRTQIKYVRRWLDQQHCSDVEDLLEGACEPLAFYLSIYIQSAIQEGVFEDLNQSLQGALKNLENMKPSKAAKIIFQDFIKPDNRGPAFWGSTLEGSYMDFLFGTEIMRSKVAAAIHSTSCISIMPLYILNYIFDGDELNEEDLSKSTIETAQYSCHAVGLIFDCLHRRIIVADPNGPLIPGSNMEFIKTPLTKRRAPPSTKQSSFDLELEILAIRKTKKRKIDELILN